MNRPASAERSSGAETRHSRLVELINPVRLPEAGFQSYEQLKNNAAEQRPAFIADEIERPALEYPSFRNLSAMDQGIVSLAEARERVEALESDPVRASMTKSSLEFRMAEMGYVKLLARLDYLVQDGADQATIIEVAQEARQLNEQLYGKPKPEVVSAALNEIWAQLDTKSLHPTAQVLYEELRDGFTWASREIPPLMRPTTPERLPEFDHNEALAWVGEHVLEANADIEALLYEFWEQKIAEHGEAYSCGPDDIVEAFEQVLDLMDPDGESGVRVILNEGSSALSWESPLMAVMVGDKRAPIKDHETLFQKVLHELRVHGGRAISGLQTEMPVLGTGLFTETERPDYLMFEEGFAVTLEEAVSGKDPVWDGAKLGHYLNIYLAEQGYDFRDVYETAWRYRTLLDIGSGQEVTDELLEKKKKAAYNACVRIFRGNQTNLPDSIQERIGSMTYNKDLAYLEGRVLAMKHLEELKANEDIEGLDRLFLAKYDPTNEVQDEVVRAIFNTGVSNDGVEL